MPGAVVPADIRFTAASYLPKGLPDGLHGGTRFAAVPGVLLLAPTAPSAMTVPVQPVAGGRRRHFCCVPRGADKPGPGWGYQAEACAEGNQRIGPPPPSAHRALGRSPIRLLVLAFVSKVGPSSSWRRSGWRRESCNTMEKRRRHDPCSSMHPNGDFVTPTKTEGQFYGSLRVIQ
jgi:hypothetical protein